MFKKNKKEKYVFKKRLSNDQKQIIILENRIQDMSEIITDFERTQFVVEVDEYYTLIKNDKIEVITGEVETELDKNGNFSSKKVRFMLNHPRTYR